MFKIVFIFLFIQNIAFADYLPWSEIEKRFAKVSEHPKALSHVKCFFDKHQSDKFTMKLPSDIGFYNRCFATPTIALESTRVFAIVDYMVDSTKQRMFLIDRETGEISTMAVSHGRYQAGFFNTKMEDKKNTIKDVKYFSNVNGSLASSTGFFIAGQEHYGEKFGRSLAIHGLEEGVNDNACERDVVIHPHVLMTKERAHMMSSGCLMVSPDIIDHVINLLKGESFPNTRLISGGGLLFIYGPREDAWESETCDGNFRSI
jgi:hypothetical protein